RTIVADVHAGHTRHNARDRLIVDCPTHARDILDRHRAARWLANNRQRIAFVDVWRDADDGLIHADAPAHWAASALPRKPARVRQAARQSVGVTDRRCGNTLVTGRAVGEAIRNTLAGV